jgi:hypothetical protein
LPKEIEHSISRISENYLIFAIGPPYCAVTVFAKDGNDIALYKKYERYVLLPKVYPYLTPSVRIVTTDIPSLIIHDIDTGEILFKR